MIRITKVTRAFSRVHIPLPVPNNPLYLLLNKQLVKLSLPAPMYIYAHCLFRLLFLSIISTAYHLLSGSWAARLLLNSLTVWKHTYVMGVVWPQPNPSTVLTCVAWDGMWNDKCNHNLNIMWSGFWPYCPIICIFDLQHQYPILREPLLWRGVKILGQWESSVIFD